jgi:hypothetical protein
VSRPGWLAYINEEGKLDELPVNRVSTLLLEMLIPGFVQHDVLVGTVLWLGHEGPGETSVSPRLITALTAIAGGMIDDDTPVTVVRWRNDVWVYDTLDSRPFVDNVDDLVDQANAQASAGNGFDTIEVNCGLTKGRWQEIRVEIMDDIKINLHDNREDRSYG